MGLGRAEKDTINSIGLSRKHLYEGMVASLKRLQLDYVDLVRCISPPAAAFRGAGFVHQCLT